MPFTTTKPVGLFTDINGKPLDGQVFFGQPNLDPIANPITVYWDAAGTQPVTQPVVTVGGYPMNGSTRSNVFVNADYSILVRNRNGFTVFSAPNLPFEDSSDNQYFLQAGSGAVQRTVQSKLRDVVSVKDFGAVGDGVADDTVAIQDAINSGAKSVYLPVGTYAIQGYINLTGKTNVRLYGDGYEVCTLLKPDNAPTYGGRMIYVSGATDIVLEGFYINGNGTNQTAYDEDSSIEIWNASNRVAIRNVRINEALRYGVYLKGDTTNGMPTNTLIENVRTNNSLGTDSGGTPGALGRTGCALISSSQTVVRNCVFQDLFDIESNTATQYNTGRIEGNVFYAGADVGANAVGAPNDPPIFIGNVFYANTNRPATVIAYGGLFSGNTFTTYVGGTQVVGNYIGLGLPENNGGNAIVEGNKFYGFVVGIAVGNLQPNGFISGNTIYCPATTTGTVSYDSKTFNYAGISTAPTSAIRSGAIHNNKVAVLSAFNTAGGYAIDSQSTNVRSLSLVGNDCHLSDTHQIAKIYAVVTRSYADRISGNSATVHTNLTGTNSVLRYENNWFTTNFADRVSAPSGGTPASGDVALIYNARSSASPTEAYLQWYYTVDAGWKKAGAVT